MGGAQKPGTHNHDTEYFPRPARPETKACKGCPERTHQIGGPLNPPPSGDQFSCKLPRREQEPYYEVDSAQGHRCCPSMLTPEETLGSHNQSLRDACQA